MISFYFDMDFALKRLSEHVFPGHSEYFWERGGVSNVEAGTEAAREQPRPQRGPRSPAQPSSPGEGRKAPFYLGCHLGVRHHEGGFHRSPEMMAS